MKICNKKRKVEDKTILKKVSWVTYKHFHGSLVLLVGWQYQNLYQFNVAYDKYPFSTMLLNFLKKYKSVAYLFSKKTSQKIVAYKPLLIKHIECIMIRQI